MKFFPLFISFITYNLFAQQPTVFQMEGGRFRTTNTYQTCVWDTINLNYSYVSPVIFVIPATDGGHPTNFRLNNITSNSFDLTTAEPPSHDGPHISMVISYIVVEEGDWELPDGTFISVHKIDTDALIHYQGGDTITVSLPEGRFQNPLIIAQIQSLNNEQNDITCQPSQPWLTIAVRNVTPNSFELALDGNECTVDPLAEVETIGWMAIEGNIQGSFVDDNGTTIQYETIITDPVVTGWDDGGAVINFNITYNDLPRFVATLQTRTDSDGGWIRYSDLTTNSVRLVIDEDMCVDQERNHSGEVAGIFTFSNDFIYRNTDPDGDGIDSDQDNCPLDYNPNQEDFDQDGLGDACDDDDDNDGDPDSSDCQPLNPDINHNAQEICDGLDNNCDNNIDEGFPDSDQDGSADCIDSDDDNDSIPDDQDNCPLVNNPNQEDFDQDGLGDACDDDDDNDGDPDSSDCGPYDPDMYNGHPEICDGKDNDCDGDSDEDFSDIDQDGLADCIDIDDDGDGIIDSEDNCPLVPNPDQQDSDGDGIGDLCEQDTDGDGIEDDLDNCPNIPNPDQQDYDNDGAGDPCDDDDDNDGDPDSTDCDPLNGSIAHTRNEICNDGIDNDCDSFIDNEDDDCPQEITDAGVDIELDTSISDIDAGIDIELDISVEIDISPDIEGDISSDNLAQDTTADNEEISRPGGGCSCSLVRLENIHSISNRLIKAILYLFLNNLF